MKIWQKTIVLVASVIVIALFIMWWMSYEPLKVIIKNERNESINVSLRILTVDDVEIFSHNFSLNGSSNITLSNITTFAGTYYIEINDTISEKKKIKYGKYYDIIEVIIRNDGIEIRNERRL